MNITVSDTPPTPSNQRVFIFTPPKEPIYTQEQIDKIVNACIDAIKLAPKKDLKVVLPPGWNVHVGVTPFDIKAGNYHSSSLDKASDKKEKDDEHGLYQAGFERDDGPRDVRDTDKAIEGDNADGESVELRDVMAFNVAGAEDYYREKLAKFFTCIEAAIAADMEIDFVITMKEPK